MDRRREAQSVTHAQVRPVTPYEVEPYGRYEAFKTDEGKTVQLVQFSNTAAMVNFVEDFNDKWTKDRKVNGQDFMKFSLDNDAEEHDWTFGSYHKTPKQTWDAISHGKPNDMYQDIVNRAIDEIRGDADFAALLRTVISHKKKRKYVESGHELSIDRAMAGDTACWTVKSQNRKIKAVRLAVGLTMTAGNKEKDFMAVLIAVTKATYLINSLGLPVEIVGESFVEGYIDPKADYYHLAGITVMLKRAEDPLDYSKIATYFTPGMCRMVVFKLREALFEGKKSTGMGTTSDMGTDLRDYLSIDYTIGKNWKDGEEKLRLTEMVHDLIAKSTRGAAHQI